MPFHEVDLIKREEKEDMGKYEALGISYWDTPEAISEDRTIVLMVYHMPQVCRLSN